MGGWVRIERDIFEHRFFANEPFSEREAFIWIIAKATYQDTKHRVGGKLVDVPRGSFFCTHREMQRVWRWRSLWKVQTFLSRLEADEMVRVITDAGKTRIVVRNYRRYQDAEPTSQEPAKSAPPPAPQEPVGAEIASDRELLLEAMGHAPDAMTPGGRVIGNNSDMFEAGKWSKDLGLSLDEQISVIRDVMARRRGNDPPVSFKFFTNAMQRFAGEKNAPPLEPETITQIGGHHGPRRQQKPPDSKSAFIRAFAEG